MILYFANAGRCATFRSASLKERGLADLTSVWPPHTNMTGVGATTRRVRLVYASQQIRNIAVSYHLPESRKEWCLSERSVLVEAVRHRALPRHIRHGNRLRSGETPDQAPQALNLVSEVSFDGSARRGQPLRSVDNDPHLWICLAAIVSSSTRKPRVARFSYGCATGRGIAQSNSLARSREPALGQTVGRSVLCAKVVSDQETGGLQDFHISVCRQLRLKSGLYSDLPQEWPPLGAKQFRAL